MNNTEERRFCVDFVEFSFLVEACIPPQPIARSMFWANVIDEYYHQMSEEERVKLWEWISSNPTYQDGIKLGIKDCLLFDARFDPNNQYKVHTHYEDEKETYLCFKWNGQYHIRNTTSILEDYITKVENLF